MAYEDLIALEVPILVFLLIGIILRSRLYRRGLLVRDGLLSLYQELPTTLTKGVFCARDASTFKLVQRWRDQ